MMIAKLEQLDENIDFAVRVHFKPKTSKKAWKSAKALSLKNTALCKCVQIYLRARMMYGGIGVSSFALSV